MLKDDVEKLKLIDADKEIIFIKCIGVDEKQHICEPHKENCKCGVKVKNKKLLKDDYKKFSCYECTY